MSSSPRNATKYGIATAVLFVGLSGFSGAIAEPSPELDFGADPHSLTLLEEHGLQTQYTQLWAGAWLHIYGWPGFEEHLRRVHESARTPVIQFYYWGNELNEDCFRDGCDWRANVRKDQAGWDRLTTELTSRLQTEFGGERVVIVLETEFNKNMRTSEELDAGLAQKAQQLRAGYPGAVVVLGFGNWGQEDWHVFDRAAAAADEIGLQLMRGSVHDTPDQIRSGPDSLLAGAREAQRLFRKPIFVSDVALSSHGGPEYEAAQADALRRLFELAPELDDAGVHAIVYRSIVDVPTADTSDYYGEAERHFGLVWADNKTAKPAFEVLVEKLNQTDDEPKSAGEKLKDAFDWLPFVGVSVAGHDDPAESVDAFPKAWSQNLLRDPTPR